MCASESGYTSEESDKRGISKVHKLDAEKQWTGLAYGENKHLYAWGVTTHPYLPSLEFTIKSPCEFTFS